ncbi:MAG: EamA family transporter [Bacilli bacterium]|nr:EamA family transporter [Bacilli bacterium]MDD4808782.1 EamA family transporter [Bacilli bacterium]
MICLLFALYILLSAGGLTLFKIGSKDFVFNIIDNNINLSINWYLIAGILSYISSFFLWLYIITKMKLSIAMPISVGLVNIFVLIGAILFVGENVTWLQWIGVLIILVGLLVTNIGASLS